jgi:hypothetical protein
MTAIQDELKHRRYTNQPPDEFEKEKGSGEAESGRSAVAMEQFLGAVLVFV